MPTTTRRQLLTASAITAVGAALHPNAARGEDHADRGTGFVEPPADATFAAPYGRPLFEISVAQWSLNRLFREGQIDNRDFGVFVRNEFALGAVEWVNSFFKDKANDFAYLRDMKQRCDDAGVQTLLIMVDGEGHLGDADSSKRSQAIENHYRWVVAAKLLGGHAIRVNASSSGTWDDQRDRAADGLHRLTEFARGFGINVIVENHGGLSSNGQWLSQVVRQVGLPEFGTLPDFGNFRLGEGKHYDRFLGTHELMPFAKAVSAKCYSFNDDGSHQEFDFTRMMRIVLNHGYRGHVGVEFEGPGDKAAGVRAGVDLLKKIRRELTA